ncbi:AAA family ATPase [Mesorhizobium sp. AR10]|uniref:ATP-binding sensor histidine kinase n=1 Tax=Mesorhizobium sp. AR10 TaxID=2865839 RepID=UPI00215E65E5|nr:AAA family ATPase [Mesorhizobium sp. AR10]
MDPILLVAPIGEYSALESLKRLEHEHDLKAELDADWAVRPVGLSRHDGRMALVLEDPGGQPLDQLLGQPMDVTQYLRIAIPLAAAIGQVHRHGLIHKDIKPANALIDAAGNVRLTGFGIASRLPRERQAPAPPEIIAGTLAYMAPEQTGRMNRSIDARSDLYSLGVTFYEMLTGALPFTATDPMGWVHCHIARRPTPPSERVSGIPGPVEAIVLKLLAKTAEDRYQTAAGVETDLRRCLSAWEAHHRVESFSLAAHDASDRLVIPERLYGREAEIDALLAAFDRVASEGTTELVLVSGYAGIGKSSIVNELHKVLVLQRGLFAAGKFDQYKRDIPYATLAQAFHSLVHQLLSMDDAELNRWRNALLDSLGPNGQLMINLIPELALIIGEQPPVPDLPPQDRQNRFQLVFRRFLGVFARPEHPLALFLDDLQWLDTATLDLLEHLTHPDVRHLLLIGAYRDNEVGPSHPLARMLATIREAGGRVQDILLAPLKQDDVKRLLGDALHTVPERTRPLAGLVFEKTDGNPFFTIQFLTALAEEALMAFDPGTEAWTWDLPRISAKGFTDNVADLMAAKLSRLPHATRKALGHLACLGNVAESATLALVHGETEEATHAALWEAVRAGLLLRSNNTYSFLHDRIQEAAYALIAEGERAMAHLRIGRLLAAQSLAEELEDSIFDIVNQFDRGAALITSPEQREQVAELNLKAGKRAKAATAYAAALQYFATGRALLTENGWERCYQLSFDLELNRAECEFLTGALAEAEGCLAALSCRAANTMERATVACLRVDLYTTLDRGSRAITVGLDCLRHLGIDWSPHPTEEEARREYERIWLQLEGRTIESLIDLPLMNDPASLATLDVLAKIGPPAFYTDANLLSLVTCRAVNLSLERGNCDASCLAYEWLSMLAGPHFGDYRSAVYRFGQLGYDLTEGRGLTRFQARTYMDFGGSVVPWTRHVRAGRDLVRRAFEAANKIGDLNYAAYCGKDLTTNLLTAGDPLAEAEREADHGLAFAQKMRFGLVVDCMSAQRALIRMLRGLTTTFGSFDDAQFDELRIERRFLENPDLALVECWYWIWKLQARFFGGDYASALEASSKAKQLLWTLVSLEVAEYHFYGALSQAASCDTAAEGEPQRQRLDAVAAHHGQLQLWATNCPENFENRAALVGAELARLEGRDVDAMRLYDLAISSARANGFIHHEALANELAARFYAVRGFEKIAHVYLQDARYGYMRWGADGKVRQIEQLHPHLRDAPVPISPTTTIGTPVEQLDVDTVVKASQAVSGEIELGKLIETLMRIAAEHAGAERGLLILLRGDEPRIVAEATAGHGRVEVTVREAAVLPSALPDSVLHYVIRTRESVVLDDASVRNLYSDDEYVRQKHPRSVLCLPVVKQTKLVGALYLENNLTPYAFTASRVAVLELLASQAAISLENARLYSDRKRAEEELRRSEAYLAEAQRLSRTGSFGWSAATGEVIWSDETFRIFGYDKAPSATIDMVVQRTHPNDRAAVQQTVDRAARDGKDFDHEYRLLMPDGSMRYVHAVAHAVKDASGNIEFFGAVTDVTATKRAEDALRESEQRFRDYAETASDWLWETGPDHRIIHLSEQIARIGTSAAGRIGLRRWDVATDLDEEPEKWSQHIATLEARRPFRGFVFRVAADDGSARYIAGSGKPVFDPGGRFLGYRGVGSDVTAAIRAEQAEEALHKTQMELAHVTRVTTLGELAASIAHEVNQPLAAIVTNGEVGLRWLNRETPDLAEVREAVGAMISDGRRASEIILRLRALAGKTETQKVAVDINGAISEVIPLVQHEVLSHRVSLRVELAPTLPAVLGDRVQLQQVIINLIVNGMEAMAPVTDRARQMVVRSQLDDSGKVLVAVEDSGVGIDPENAKQLFNAFFTTKPSGMGMGLSICRSIIENHGGRLWASRNTGPGATFQFVLPSHPEVRS